MSEEAAIKTYRLIIYLFFLDAKTFPENNPNIRSDTRGAKSLLFYF